MSDLKEKAKIKDKFRIPIEINVNDDINRNRLLLIKFLKATNRDLRIKYHATKKKDDMFERIDRDVEQAINDYNEALTEEDKAQVRRSIALLL